MRPLRPGLLNTCAGANGSAISEVARRVRARRARATPTLLAWASGAGVATGASSTVGSTTPTSAMKWSTSAGSKTPLIQLPRWLVILMAGTSLDAAAFGNLMEVRQWEHPFWTNVVSSAAVGPAGTLMLLAVLERARRGRLIAHWRALHSSVAGQLEAAARTAAGRAVRLAAAMLDDPKLGASALPHEDLATVHGFTEFARENGLLERVASEASGSAHAEMVLDRDGTRVEGAVDELRSRLEFVIDQLSPSPLQSEFGPAPRRVADEAELSIDYVANRHDYGGMRHDDDWIGGILGVASAAQRLSTELLVAK